MNLTKLAVMFVIITLPFYFISDISIQQMTQRKMLKDQYASVINNAVDDGTLALRLYARESFDDASKKNIEVDAQEVMNAFLSSYYYGFNAVSDTDQIRVGQYILAAVIVAYDGYYIYGTKEVAESVCGDVLYRPVLSEKYPFVYEEGDVSVMLTLDDNVSVVDTSMSPWAHIEGPVTDGAVAAVLPHGLDVNNHASVRDYVITETIEKALTKTVYDHNLYTTGLGTSYLFHLPSSDNEGLRRNFSDLSLMVFIQGKDLGGGQYLEMNAVNQGSVIVGNMIEGYTGDPSVGVNEFYYCDQRCTHPKDDTYLVKYFGTKEEAASEGYWPCQFVGK